MKTIISRAAVLGILFSLVGAFSAPPARGAIYSYSAVEYFLTADIVALTRGDYEVEFGSILTHNSAWAVRAGYFKHYPGSEATPYSDGKGRWGIGFRWRYYLLQHSPHLIFLGVGWDNRPQDAEALPLGEAGVALHFKPLSVMALGYYGYEFYLKSQGLTPNRWISGFEVRAGLCF